MQKRYSKAKITKHVFHIILLVFLTAVAVHYTLTTILNPIADIPNKSLDRFKAIHFIVDKYGIKGLSSWEKVKISRCFLALPEDTQTLYCLAISSWESQFYPRAKGKISEDYGIAQFNLPTGIAYLKLCGHSVNNKEDAIKLLYKPEVSIPCQYAHISDLSVIHNGNLKKILFTYNKSSAYVDTVYKRVREVIRLYDSVYVEESKR